MTAKRADPGTDRIRPRPLSAFCRASLGGSIGLGSSYADRKWDVANLVGLLRRLYSWTRPHRYLGSLGANLVEAHRGSKSLSLAPASREIDGANVAYHYDLPPEWFALFLDDSLSYSGGLYVDPAGSLSEAQERKIDRVCDRLELDETTHLLDIGAGWGALALTASKNWNAQVTATTTSARQRDYLRRKARHESLTHRIQVLGDSYDQLTGTYDAIASVEMIEALDWQRHGELLAVCGRLLESHGRFVLQAITIQDLHFHRTKRHEEFIKRFIFPGGCLPSRRSLEHQAEAAGLEVVEIVSLGEDYARTLAAWRTNLEMNRDAAIAMGMSDGFVRRWCFYLAYCEAGFRERYLDDHQLLLRHH